MTDRVIIYAGVGAQDTDLLRVENYQRRAMNYLARMLMSRAAETGVLWNFAPVGTSGLTLTLSDGALVGPLTVEDAAAMGSIPASALASTPIAVNLAQTVLGPFSVPTVAGQSANHLVTAQFATSDTDNQVFFYQNPANPGQTWQGVGNNGQAQPSTRRESVVFAIVPGIAAATGTQATPAAPAGTVPAYVVTVAAGTTTLPLANAVEHPASPFYPGLAKTWAGNPNGNVSGRAAKGGLPPSTCWDSANSVLYSCVLTGTAALAQWVSKAGFGTTQYFQASGTFTPPPGVTRARVRAWGGGAGGGGTTGANSGGSGGGGGGFVEGVIAIVPGQSYAVTVGAGGAGGTSAGDGAAGGASSFGSLLSSTGGAPGRGANGAQFPTGGVGGATAGGSFSVPGQPGGGAFALGSAAVAGGIGGGTWQTSGSQFSEGSSALPGQGGVFPGGGASGGVFGGPGGAGAPGLVIVDF